MGMYENLELLQDLGVPGPKCFNPEFGELVSSLTPCDVADAMDAVYAVDAVDAVEDVDAVDAVDDVNVFTRFARFTSSCRISRLHVFTSSRASPQNLRTAAAINATFYLHAFYIRAHGPEKRLGQFFVALFILSFCRSRVLWVLDFCRVHAPETAALAPVTPEFDFPSCSKSLRSPENPCPKHNNVRVPRAYGDQSIHAQTIIPFVFQEHMVTRASMPKP